jgi:hypothetical protein
MRTIQLTVVVDDAYPMRERIVMGAIQGIVPSIRRVATNLEYEVYDGAVRADEKKGEQR